MAKAVAEVARGTKRVCPETDKKFYDLEKDPIVSPYTGKEYPLSFFEESAAPVADTKAAEPEKDKEEDEIELETGASVEAGPEFVSLEDADDDDADDAESIPDIDGDDDDEVTVDEDDNTFLETDDDENNDVSDLIVASDDDEN